MIKETILNLSIFSARIFLMVEAVLPASSDKMTLHVSLIF
jgi:hypothetical protein